MSELNEKALAEIVRSRYETQTAVVLRGHGSKDFYGNRDNGYDNADGNSDGNGGDGNNGNRPHILETATGETALCGILEYEPSELFVGVWAGTPIAQVRTELAKNRQMLAFDPPMFGGAGTVGGALACGLAGPGRAFYGGARDAMLGVTLINGTGEILRFGGRVIKNVAGYDISRLSVGALGTLGIVSRAFLRVAPAPAGEETRKLQMNASEAPAFLQKLARAGAAPSASFHDGEVLHLRFSSSAEDASWAAKIAGGETGDNSLWAKVRDHEHPFFQTGSGKRLWRLSVSPGTAQSPAPGADASEWNGALIWSRAEKPASAMREFARANGGAACLFRKAKNGGDAAAEVFQKPPAAVMRLQQEIKTAFDPARIFNRGRLYREW